MNHIAALPGSKCIYNRTMSKFFSSLQLIFALSYALGAPQFDNNEINDDYELDYSIPGIATEDCVCVPLYLCLEGDVVDDGTGIIDPRKKPQAEVGLDEKYDPPECGPYHVCCGNPDSSTAHPYEHRCGTRNPNGISGRILTSQASGEAERGEWPWQAIILQKGSGTFLKFKCGGTLIDERHVLTIAHCVDKLLDDINSIVVRLGEWDAGDDNEIFPHEDYKVSEIVIHPQYKPKNLHNDIAIVKLSRDVNFKPHIDTACLPKDEDDFTGQDCIVTGWGTDTYERGTYSTIMKEVSVPVISREECENMFRKTRLGKKFKLHASFLCAGGKEGEDSCKGDGGGPLVCYNSDHTYTVAGLVSWGLDCGQEGVPGVYVNVNKYIDWIASKTGKELPEYWSSQ